MGAGGGWEGDMTALEARAAAVEGWGGGPVREASFFVGFRKDTRLDFCVSLPPPPPPCLCLVILCVGHKTSTAFLCHNLVFLFGSFCTVCVTTALKNVLWPFVFAVLHDSFERKVVALVLRSSYVTVFKEAF